MRTLLFLLSGGLLACGCYLLIRLFTPDYPPAQAIIARGFAVLWCLIAAVNMLTGVIKAGYGWGEELTIFVAIFALPVVPLLWMVEH
ncbi:membrane protein [Klebsiella michiganensis]|nr:membrane protein [Klebsiella michiganensis]